MDHDNAKADEILSAVGRVEAGMKFLIDEIRGTGPHNPGLSSRVHTLELNGPVDARARMEKLEDHVVHVKGALWAGGVIGAVLMWVHNMWPFSLLPPPNS